MGSRDIVSFGAIAGLRLLSASGCNKQTFFVLYFVKLLLYILPISSRGYRHVFLM